MRIKIALLIVCVAAFAGCSNDNGTSNANRPTIGGMNPATLQAGQQYSGAEISGSNFVNPVSVNLGPGTATGNVTVVSPALIRFDVSVDATAAPGSRTITVNSATGSVSSTGVFSIDQNNVPVARFTVSPSVGSKNFTNFEFDASASSDPGGKINSYEWKFGDGESARGMVVRHKYAAARTFEVKLTVTDSGQAMATAVKEIMVVSRRPPMASFSVSPGSGSLTTSFRFDATTSHGDAQINRYAWDFGDGKTGHGAVVQHQYATVGDYQVVLTVTDSNGLSDNTQRKVTVDKSPTPGPATTKGCPAGLINQTFKVWSVVGNHVVVSNNIFICGGRCPDLRRPRETGLREFAGDMLHIRGNEFDITLKGFHPAVKGPSVGETMGVVWKGCD